jgi:hypothetical protein
MRDTRKHKVRFLFTKGAPLNKGKAIPGLIVSMLPSEAQQYERAGKGRVLAEDEAKPKKAKKKAAKPAKKKTEKVDKADK